MSHSFKLVTLLTTYLSVFTPLVHAQFIQNYQWTVQNGVQVPTYRRREADTPGRVHAVTPLPIVEYNCHYMKAICKNAKNWIATAPRAQNRKLQQLYGNANTQVFTYDFGIENSKVRGEEICPTGYKTGISAWKDRPENRCPEDDQPPVMPGPWFSTALETMDSVRDNEIVAERDLDVRTGKFDITRRSGLIYTCEEFPPRSWVEGGIGYDHTGPSPPPEGNGEPGYTYCAPMQITSCKDTLNTIDEDVKWSEQNWQGQAHLKLRDTLLQAYSTTTGRQLDQQNEFMVLGLRFTDDSNSEHPARVYWQGQPPIDHYVALDAKKRLISSTSFFTFLSNETELFTNTSIPEQSTPISPVEDVKPWNVSGTAVGALSDSYRFGTHQTPDSQRIDILALSEKYILGQVNNTMNGTRPGNTTTHPSSVKEKRTIGNLVRFGDGITRYTPLNKRDGPVQCGPGSPCLDESCCSVDGKCGFKAAHCGAGNCTSNCDAKAMCGIDSADGKTSCGLKLCCSYYGWCGTESVHCYDPEPQFGKTPCQQAFGSCVIRSSPSCSKSSGTAAQRKVAYYQGWNTRDRKCDRVRPSQINTRGLTHLFYAFVFFHPQTFEMMPMNDADTELYGEFTSLARNGLQTWVAIGGWSFNDPGPTQHAWSDMVSTASNRAAFIQSLIKFMDTYGFQGADLDWEYPVNEKRGGRPADADNLVLLVKEMKDAFAGKYGISLTLAPDYWYLRGFKPAAMQDYVDFMGFMAYDLHGPWDEDVKTLGSLVRPQTDITEIDKDLTPLWFDGVNPSKINMGIAYYGRTYQLSSASCGSMGCGFKGPGAAGKCTAFAGVLSNREIRAMIEEHGYKPYLNETAMVKYFTYGGDSWVGYDDEETIAMKTAFANSRCLGGTMIWSIDFDAETGGGGPANIYKSPENATIIPMAHTTVPPGSTYTLDTTAATDVVGLPNDGNQNTPKGPGAEKCGSCGFFRLISSTCCGVGGSLGNPIVIPANTPVPMDIILPAGFVPNQDFSDRNGQNHPGGTRLPSDTILPIGAIFPIPFIIPAGQPLRNEDEDQGNNGSLIYIDPKIWNEENPEIQCYWPCTFVLPPWTKTSQIIDYPRVTISEDDWITTITYPPYTTTEIWVSKITVKSVRSSETRKTTTVETEKSTTWPPITFPGKDGGSKTTRPNPPPPPPTIKIKFPELTIINGGPPKPTVKPFPTPCISNCPAPPPVNEDQEEYPDKEIEEEENPDTESFCLPGGGGGDPNNPGNNPGKPSGGGSPSPSSSPTPTPVPPKKPDFSTDKIDCYNSGQTANRDKLIDATNRFCDEKGKKSWSESIYIVETFLWDWDESEGAGIAAELGLEVKEGCEWVGDSGTCKSEMTKIIDGCDTSTTTKKLGGRMENNCIKMHVDPNKRDDISAPPAPKTKWPIWFGSCNTGFEVGGGGFTEWTAGGDPCSKDSCTTGAGGLAGKVQWSGLPGNCAEQLTYNEKGSSSTLEVVVKRTGNVIGTCTDKVDLTQKACNKWSYSCIYGIAYECEVTI